MQAAILVITHAKFPVWAVMGIVAGIFGFARGFRLLRRKRLILNTPASKIRSASMGLVEISGLARGPHVIISPLKQVECYYYRSLAWELKQRGKNREWVKVADEALHIPFYVDDNTDKLLIDPTGADMDLHCDLHEEYHESIFFGSDVPQTVSGFLARHGVTPRGKIKVEEYCIKPENFLFVLGTLSQNPGLDASVRPAWAVRAGEPLPLASPPKIPPQRVTDAEPLQQVIRLSAGLPVVPVSQMTQQQRIAAALARAGAMQTMPWAGGTKVDLQPNRRMKDDGAPKEQERVQPVQTEAESANGAEENGRLKLQAAPANGSKAQPDEAGKVPPTDAAELLNEFARAAGVADGLVAKPGTGNARVPFDPSGFDLHPPVVLMKGSNEPTFFISWRSQRDVVNALNWQSTLLIWGCPALVLACVWAIMMYLR